MGIVSELTLELRLIDSLFHHHGAAGQFNEVMTSLHAVVINAMFNSQTP